MLKRVFYVGFILSFLGCFVFFFVPRTNASIQIAFFLWFMVAFLCMLNNYKRFFAFYKKVFKISLVKILFTFLGYALILSTVHIFLGHYQAEYRTYLFRTYKFLVVCPLLYLYPVLAIYLRIDLRKIVKLYVLIVYMIFAVGILQFLANILHISFLTNIINFFTNAGNYAFFSTPDVNNSNRVFSIFSEPSVVGYFAFINMPLIFNFSITKIKIYKNPYLNFFIKKTFLLITIFAVILSQSPVGIIVCFSSLIVLCVLKYKSFLVKNSLKIFISMICIFSILNLNPIMEEIKTSNFKVITRIIKTFEAMYDPQEFAKVEPSLASRVISTQILLNVIKQNPVSGVGFANVDCYVDTIFNKLPIKYYTLEVMNNHIKYRNATAINESVMFTTLAETGIIGWALFYYFCILNAIILFKISKKYTGIEKIFISSLANCIISILIYSFYTSTIRSVHLWLIFACSLMYIYHFKYIMCGKKKLLTQNVNQEDYE